MLNVHFGEKLRKIKISLLTGHFRASDMIFEILDFCIFATEISSPSARTSS